MSRRFNPTELGWGGWYLRNRRAWHNDKAGVAVCERRDWLRRVTVIVIGTGEGLRVETLRGWDAGRTAAALLALGYAPRKDQQNGGDSE